MDADTAMHVGEPKFRLPVSEKACAFSFFSFVHRTTSQGGDGVSPSPPSSCNWLLTDALRLCVLTRAGEDGRRLDMLGVEMRDWNRRSNGRNDGVGLLRPGRDATDGRTLLLGEEMTEP